MDSILRPRNIGIGVLVFVLLLLAFCSTEVISPDERAVKVTLGEVSDVDYGPGVQFKMPIFTHFETASTKPVTQDVTIGVGQNGAISSDNQTLGLAAKVAWRYDTSKIRELVTKYPNRSVLEDLVNNTVYEALKAEVGKYRIFDLATNAGKIATEAKNAASAKVADFPVVITQVNLTNWDWDDAFDAQIKATMASTQQVTKAKADADKIEQEQRALAIKAEAGAKALVAQAEGEKQAAVLRADAKRAEGQGIADYNAKIAQNLATEIKFRELEIDKIREERRVYVSQYIPLTANGTAVMLPAAVAK